MSKVDLLPHNIETFFNIIELYKLHNRVCAIQATGTGKTYLELRLLEEIKKEDKKALILAPSDYILEQTLEKMEEYNLTNAGLLNYVTLMLMNQRNVGEIESLDCDYIFLDEMHRIGAEEWGAAVNKLLETHPNVKVFGITATPVRSDGRNISEEYFNGIEACNISLAEAIVREIVRMPQYISALYSFDNIVKELKTRINKSNNTKEEKTELRKQLNIAKHQLEKSHGVPKIIKKYIQDYNGKYIIFCENTKHLDLMKTQVEKWFRESGFKGIIRKYEVFSENTESDSQFELFKKDNEDGLKLLFSIDMLNEGLHVPDASGVILLRPTQSHIVYYQQIGRAIDAGRNDYPLILDLVDNSKNVLTGSTLQDDINKEIIKRQTGNYFGCSKEIDVEHFTITDEIKDCVQVFEEIESDLLNRNWSKNEDNVLIQYYPSEGQDVVKRLKNRTIAACNNRAKFLGVHASDKYWTKEEDMILIKHYKEEKEKCFNRIINKTTNACRGRIYILNLKLENFDCNKNNIIKLKEYIDNGLSFPKIAKEFHNEWTSNTLRKYAHKYCLYNKSGWDKKEDEIIKKYYPIEGFKVCLRLKNRTEGACMTRAKRLNVKSINGIKKSKYKYVYFSKRNEKFVVEMIINGKKKYFGYFDSEDEAGKVAMEKAKEYGKHF